MILDTITSPVMAQITTVSQNVPEDDTRACRTGLRVCAAAATMGAEPSPDSFENNPRAMPYLAANITDEPTNPPPAASGENADTHISLTAGQRYCPLIISITIHPTT